MPETKQQRQRSITFDSLRVHAAKLDLASKVTLVKELKEQIDAQVKQLHEAANQAGTLASQLTGPVTRGPVA